MTSIQSPPATELGEASRRLEIRRPRAVHGGVGPAGLAPRLD
jgi:hypothetical protein